MSTIVSIKIKGTLLVDFDVKMNRENHTNFFYKAFLERYRLQRRNFKLKSLFMSDNTARFTINHLTKQKCFRCPKLMEFFLTNQILIQCKKKLWSIFKRHANENGKPHSSETYLWQAIKITASNV